MQVARMLDWFQGFFLFLAVGFCDVAIVRIHAFFNFVLLHEALALPHGLLVAGQRVQFEARRG